jgi:hypothetical protein
MNPVPIATRAPGQSDVLAQHRKISASPQFRASPRLSRFLRFAVDRALEGKAHELKETVIGVEVFDRDASYSPREDPIVRVMAGRLRAKLGEYYESEGLADPVLIELPRGGYIPRFSSRERLRSASSAISEEVADPTGRHRSFLMAPILMRWQGVLGLVVASTLAGVAGGSWLF